MSAIIASSRQMSTAHTPHAKRPSQASQASRLSDASAASRVSDASEASARATSSHTASSSRSGDSRSGERTKASFAPRSRSDDAFSRGGDRREPNGPSRDRERPGSNNGSRRAFTPRGGGQRSQEKADHPILFQHFFKSVGPRTYAVQVKQATNGNHYIVFTEGRRDDKTDDVRKTRINIFSEDFDAFFDLLRQAAQFVKANPLSPEFVAKRKKMWAAIAKKKARPGTQSARGQGADARGVARSVAGTPAVEGSSGSSRDATPRDRSSGTGSSARADEKHVDHGSAPEQPRQEPPAAARNRSARPLPSARAAAGT